MPEVSRKSPARSVSVIGLGYVGLPVATALAGAGHRVIGFDRDAARIAEIRAGHDRTRSVAPESLDRPGLTVTDDPAALAAADIHIVAVPTPIDVAKQPDMSALRAASETVGAILKRGDIVVYESTVYPGATREFAVPILERVSGLASDTDFAVGYSPERIDPGSDEHKFRSIRKIVSASTEAARDTLAALYQSAIDPEVYLAPSIEVAEAAKVIENTQRDLNIALMNELAQLFHTLGIDTRDVLEAAATKWNFHRYQPGLVGGHCIGVDPYYLTYKALQSGREPQVVLAGRGTNEAMTRFVASSAIQECVALGKALPLSILVIGVTYKANVPDTRNSKALELIAELEKFGARAVAWDPVADRESVARHHAIELIESPAPDAYDAVVLAVDHDEATGGDAWAFLVSLLKDGSGLVMDIPARLDRAGRPEGVRLWRL